MNNKKKQINIFFEYKEETLISSINKRPEIILPIAFFSLCAIGTILLLLPISKNMSVTFLDTLFTAVSASCVTGLSVLNIGESYNFFGQLILLFLIQTGGLGIMSITSIIFIVLGKRMSLSQEKSARKILDVESQEEIKTSLKLIFNYTFLAETIGAIIFILAFLAQNKEITVAIWQGIFLSVSAFCNAGFTLNPLGIVEYQNNPVILYTTAILVLLGATSPAISVLIPKWLKRQKISPQAVIVINTTLFLIILGTIFLLCSESYELLNNLTFMQKLNHAIFQAVATKTAGFSSFDFANINIGTYLLMLVLMSIGGSPGGTAGGIKTCTIGVLVLTAYNFMNEKANIVRNKNITFETVQKAIALIFLYFIILSIVILALLTTQNLEADKLIFEATSALGTTGVSMGITSSLDEVGKVIIMIAMFIGRVAPTTFLCYLNSKNCDTNLSYPDAKITLT
ncbi:hypothetical protein J6Q66_05150 [bacterium]|nr:hypothetical protein [bacterium]